MTIFLDLRAIPSGGWTADEVTIRDSDAPGSVVSVQAFEASIRGKALILATHGFNVNSKDGLHALSTWAGLCQLPSDTAYIGVLWPGDSRFIPVLDYPIEGHVALTSGRLLSTFLNAYTKGASSLSMVSHSLGARTMLETIAHLENRRVSVLILMAGAIEHDCLSKEYKEAIRKVDHVHVVASRSDAVLQFAFPIGNPVGEIVMHGHPYFQSALGREGPFDFTDIPAPCLHWQVPDTWDYGHGNYLPGSQRCTPMPPPCARPGDKDPQPANPPDWKPGWSASVISTQFRP